MRQDTWGPPAPARRMPPSAAASPRWVRRNAAQQVEAHYERPDARAYLAVYEALTERAYMVRTLSDDRVIQVPKSYAPSDPFPVVSGQRAPGVHLLHWSVIALFGVGLGGLGGILLGVPVVLAACVQLARFARRVRRWRQRRPGVTDDPRLPAAATVERLRLLGALGQGLLAIALGCLVLGLVAWHLLG